MSKHFITDVPKYFEPQVNDCFSNALTSYILYKKLNHNIIMTDYLSLMYDKDNGYLGLNYLSKPNSTVFFTEEELNTSYHFIYMAPTETYKAGEKSNIHIQDKKKIYISKYIDDSNDAYLRTKELIDNDIPVVAAVDLYYMKYHRAYQKEHGLHYVVITGYDEENKYYEVFDKFKLTSCDFDGKLPISDVISARDSNNPQSNPVMGLYERKILNNWIEAKIGDDFSIDKEDILSIITESVARMKGQKEILANKCGIGVLKDFKEYIQSKKQEEFDEQNKYYFGTYLNQAFKVISRNRKRFKIFINEAKAFFTIESADEIEECLEQSSKSWDISANLCYKLAICKKILLIDDICTQIDKIIEKESTLIEKLDDLIYKIK